MTSNSVARRNLTIALVIVGLLLSALVAAAQTLVFNPYEGLDWNATQQKANLHTHTTQSDGAMPPARVIDEYHERGYDILALTDHNLCTYPWQDYGRDPSALNMLAISGNELSRHHHTGSLFCELETDETDHNAALNEVAAQGGLAILYHPGRYWRPAGDAPEAVPADVLERYAGLFSRHGHLVGMEIINQGNRYPHDRLLWDALLGEMMPDRPVHAFCDDDMHGTGTLGRDWTVFPLQALTEQTVREALQAGAFYSASVSTHPKAERSVEGTPVIDHIVHDPEIGVLSVYASVGGEPVEAAGYRWVSEGEALHVGPELQYQEEDGIGSYVRVEIVGPGGTAFTNAFGFAHE